MKQFKSLLVVWKNNKTNVYYHIGTLSFNGTNYTFEYTHHSNSFRKVHDAIQNGYYLHPAFPELRKKYVSTSLFPAFDRRVPSKERVGYEKILKDLGLPENADRMDVLRETRGMLSGDSYSFEEPLQLDRNNMLRTNFFINGMRYQEGLPDKWYHILKKDSPLKLELDDDNEFDPYAVKIKTTDNLLLGYVPGIYAQAISTVLKNNVEVKLTIKEINPNFAPQWWVRVSINAHISYIDSDKFIIALEGLVVKAA